MLFHGGFALGTSAADRSSVPFFSWHRANTALPGLCRLQMPGPGEAWPKPADRGVT